MNPTETCPFCAEVRGINLQTNDFTKLEDSDFSNRIIWENNLFALIPPIGCFVEGYCLLLTKKHIASFGLLSTEEFLNLENVVAEIKEYLIEEYGGFIMFEHGSSSCDYLEAGACIGHAHLHFIPQNVNLKTEIEKVFSVQEISKLNELSSFARSSTPYLMFSTPEGNRYVAEAYGIESQFMRKLFTSEAGIASDWDWRRFPFVDKMKRTYANLSAKMKNKSIIQINL